MSVGCAQSPRDSRLSSSFGTGVFIPLAARSKKKTEGRGAASSKSPSVLGDQKATPGTAPQYEQHQPRSGVGHASLTGFDGRCSQVHAQISDGTLGTTPPSASSPVGQAPAFIRELGASPLLIQRAVPASPVNSNVTYNLQSLGAIHAPLPPLQDVPSQGGLPPAALDSSRNSWSGPLFSARSNQHAGPRASGSLGSQASAPLPVLLDLGASAAGPGRGPSRASISGVDSLIWPATPAKVAGDLVHHLCQSPAATPAAAATGAGDMDGFMQQLKELLVQMGPEAAAAVAATAASVATGSNSRPLLEPGRTSAIVRRGHPLTRNSTGSLATPSSAPSVHSDFLPHRSASFTAPRSGSFTAQRSTGSFTAQRSAREGLPSSYCHPSLEGLYSRSCHQQQQQATYSSFPATNQQGPTAPIRLPADTRAASSAADAGHDSQALASLYKAIMLLQTSGDLGAASSSSSSQGVPTSSSMPVTDASLAQLLSALNLDLLQAPESAPGSAATAGAAPRLPLDTLSELMPTFSTAHAQGWNEDYLGGMSPPNLRDYLGGDSFSSTCSGSSFVAPGVMGEAARRLELPRLPAASFWADESWLVGGESLGGSAAGGLGSGNARVGLPGVSAEPLSHLGVGEASPLDASMGNSLLFDC